MANKIKIHPDPAPAGGEVEVQYDGPRPLYYREFGGGGWKEVPLDRGGRIRVPRGRFLLFSNRTKPRQEAIFDIVDPG